MPPEIQAAIKFIVNSVTLIYGDTGSGKSTLIATGAEYVWETFRKITRLYTADLGGFPARVERLVKLGIMEVWRMRNYIEPFEACERASQGWWPVGIDPRTGIAPHNATLVGPIQVRFSLLCPNGHVVKSGISQASLTPTKCQECSKGGKPLIVNLQNGKIEREVVHVPGFEHVGAVACEGLTSWQNWIMEDMASRRARGDLLGEDTAIGGKIVAGSLVFGANNRSHYGFAQIRAPQWLANSLTIPGLVIPPIWTALEQRATDDRKGVIVFGPEIAGQAKTPQVPSWVGNCLHACIAQDEQGDDEWRLYLRQHSFEQEGNVPHLAKTRTDPDLLPEFLADPPEVKQDASLRFSGFSLKNFFNLLDEALKVADASAQKEYPDAPALTGKMSAPQVTAPVETPAPQESATSAPAPQATRPGPRRMVRPRSPGSAAAGKLPPQPAPLLPLGDQAEKPATDAQPTPSAKPAEAELEVVSTTSAAPAPQPPQTPMPTAQETQEQAAPAAPAPPAQPRRVVRRSAQPPPPGARPQMRPAVSRSPQRAPVVPPSE